MIVLGILLSAGFVCNACLETVPSVEVDFSDLVALAQTPQSGPQGRSLSERHGIPERYPSASSLADGRISIRFDAPRRGAAGWLDCLLCHIRQTGSRSFPLFALFQKTTMIETRTIAPFATIVPAQVIVRGSRIEYGMEQYAHKHTAFP